MSLDIFYYLRTFFILVKTIGLNSQLYNKKKEQLNDFNRVKKKFATNYKKSQGGEIEYVVPVWNEKNTELKKRFLPYLPFNFLRDPIVMRTMFVATGGKWLDCQLEYLESRLAEGRLTYLLQEDFVGEPLLLNSKYLTSHNSIHHLYSLQKFMESTGYKFKDSQTVVEWGGGYGNLAKIIKRYNRNVKLTYVLIDTSLFSCIQWLYLATVFGIKNVRIITDKGTEVKSGLINILPLKFLKFHNIKTDLFISTWALSESTKYSQDFVVKTNWFGAKSILLSFQKASDSFPYADNLGKILIRKGGVIEEISFLPNNYYGFL